MVLSTVRRRWRLRSPGITPEARSLARRLGISPLLGQLYLHRGLDRPSAVRHFVQPRLDDILDPFLLRDMDRAVQVVSRAIEEGSKIVVHGDYDVDGITATALATRMLGLLGGSVDYFIPSRERHGYGVTEATVREVLARDAKVLIVVDSGTTAHEALSMARRAGLDVVVIDHHTPGDTLPDVDALINPWRPDSTYPHSDLCAAGLVFKFLDALLRHRGLAHRPRILESLARVAAIGTIADMVPLRGENRIIAHQGLEALRAPVNAGLRALLEVAGLTAGDAISGEDIAFRLAPRLNALGRMAEAGPGVDLLLESDPERARHLAAQVDAINHRRRETQQRVYEEALEQATSQLDADPDRRVLLVAAEGWHLGVVGIVASKLVDQFHRPTFVLGHKGDLAVGSGRGIEGCHLVRLLDRVAPRLLRYGGHERAAGLTMNAGELASVADLLDRAARETLSLEDLRPTLDAETRIDLDMLDLDLCRSIDELGPFGQANPRPHLVAQHLSLTREPRVIKEQHLKFWVGDGKGHEVEAIAFGMADRRGDLEATPGGRLALLFAPEANTWADRSRLQLRIKDFQEV